MKQSKAFKQLDQRITPDEMQLLLNSKSLYSIYTMLDVSDVLLMKYIKHYNLSYKKAFKTLKDLTEQERKNITNDWSNTYLTKREIEKKYGIGSKVLNRFITQNSLGDRESLYTDPELIKYQKLVRKLTAIIIRHYNLKTKPGYEWDHKFSVKEGFQQNIHPNIIASRDNLELIPIQDNRSNGTKCSITRDELINSVCYKSS